MVGTVNVLISAMVNYITRSYYSRDFFGEVEEIDIVPGGREKSVTVENRHEYVKAYVDYYMNKVIEAQYEAFAHVS